MKINEQLKNNIINNIYDIDNLLSNSIYYYMYKRINANDITDYIEIYNFINNTDYIIEELTENKIKIINSKKEYKTVEIIEE